jgi:mono/diheme cytochrome c family protein
MTPKMLRPSYRAWFGLTLSLLLAWASTSFADGTAPDAKALFNKRCAACHGEDGRAKTKEGKKEKIADFTTRDWAKYWNADLVAKTIDEGVPHKMPGFHDKLSADEQKLVANYVMNTLAFGPGSGGAASIDGAAKSAPDPKAKTP